MRVGILGGTGDFGRALAVRLVEAGVDVVVGSRDAEKAAATAAELGAAAGRTNADAAGDCDIAVLAVNASAALEMCDRGYVMESGGITLHDNARALLANPQVRHAYLGE